MFKPKQRFKGAPREREALLRGFTLIELLVVIAVIALLVTLSILALSNARVAARDSKRVADVKQMQSALELFYDNNNRYPTSAEFQTGSLASFSSSTGTTTYMKIIPTAPTPADGSCTDSNNNYSYAPAADGSSYTLSFCTAKKVNDVPAGTLAATPGGIVGTTRASDEDGSGPSAPSLFYPQHLASLVDNHAELIQPDSVFISGNYAYVASYGNISNALEIVDISNPAAPVHMGHIVNGEGGAVISSVKSVYVSGNYAYLTTGYGALEIVNVSDKQHPAHASVIYDGEGSTDTDYGAHLGTPDSVFVSGNYAYVADGNGALEIVDVTDPTHPIHKGSIVDGGGAAPYLDSPQSVYVVGNYAYLASYNSNALEVINVSNPAAPIHSGKVLNGTQPKYAGEGGAALLHPVSVFISGNYAYLTSVMTGSGGSLEVVDISSPTNPVHRGKISNGGTTSLSGPRGVYVSGSYAYVASTLGNALEIVDVSNTATPTHKNKISNGAGGSLLSGPYSVAVVGNYAYVASYNSNALEVVDVTNPAALTHKGSIVSGVGGPNLSNASNVFISGGHAYVVSPNDNALEIVDISNPTAPVHKGSMLNGQGGASVCNPSSVFVSGSYAYLTSYCYGDSALEIIDISSSTRPVHRGKLPNGVGGALLNNPMSVYVSGNYAYVASSGSNALEIVDVTNTSLPTPKGSIADGDENTGDGGAALLNPFSVFVSGHYAYVISVDSGALEIVDVSDPAHPHHAGKIANGDGSALLSSPYSVYVSGNYAYVASYGSSALEIVDVSDPAHPVHKGSLSDGEGGANLANPQGIFVSGNYAFLVNTGSNALEIVDVSDPAHPVHKGSLSNGSGGALLAYPVSVYVVDNYAYVASQNSNALEIIDLTGLN
jgi:prepilin-type N-terminal cleavage/methylation domain-containing protein